MPADRFKFLVLFHKDTSEDEVEKGLSEAKQRLILDLGVEEPTIVDSITWYDATFDRCGDWDPWVKETVLGVDYVSRKPHFNGFLLRFPLIGMAVANIAKLAIETGKPVLSIFPDNPLCKVTSVTCEDERNWIAGWRANVVSLGDTQ